MLLFWLSLLTLCCFDTEHCQMYKAVVVCDNILQMSTEYSTPNTICHVIVFAAMVCLRYYVSCDLCCFSVDCKQSCFLCIGFFLFPNTRIALFGNI